MHVTNFIRLMTNVCPFPQGPIQVVTDILRAFDSALDILQSSEVLLRNSSPFAKVLHLFDYFIDA